MVGEMVDPSPPAVEDAPRGPSDAELMGRLVAGDDPAALAALVGRFGRMVWGVCRRLLTADADAEDAFQAVFLVLLKQAATVHNPGGVGSWLYGVAYRTAMKARRDLAHRRTAEGKVPSPAPPPGPPAAAACRELHLVLDEEVNRLPDKFRTPFVLCCIEGLSKSEAARELGWKEGTVSGRLAEARKRLQARLVRRGIALAAALTVLELSRQSAAAAVPPLLCQATIAGLSASAAGQAAGLSPAAVSLAEGVMRMMTVFKLTVFKLKLGAALLAAAVTIGTTAVATTQPAKPEPKPTAPRQSLAFAGPPRAFLDVTDEQVLAVAVSPDGGRVVTAGGRPQFPGQIKVWDAVTGQLLQKVSKTPATRAVAVSPDGLTIACGESGSVTLRDAKTGQPQGVLKGHTIGVNGLAFSRDGSLLATAGLDKVVKLWDVKGRTEKKTFAGHTDAVFSVAFFGHGNALVSAGSDNTARVWDVAGDKPPLVLAGHLSPVEQVAVSPDDKTIATAGWDRTVRLWDAKTGTETAGLTGHREQVLAVAFSADGAWLASGSGDGEVRLWDAKTHTLAAMLGQHEAAVWSVAFSPDGKRLVSGSSDTTAKLWDVAAKREQATLATSETPPVAAIAYAPDGKTVAVATDQPVIDLYDAATGGKRATLAGHTGKVTCLAYSPDGLTLASGSADKTVRLWNPVSGTQTAALDKHTGAVHALAVSANGKRLATAGEDGAVHIWDLPAGAHRATGVGHTGAVYALAFVRDGSQLASGGADKVIRLWTPDRPADPVKLDGHERSVRALVYADDALLSGGDDGLIKVCRPAAGRSAVSPESTPHLVAGHSGLRSLAHLPGTDGFVSGGSNGEVMQWALSGPSRGLLGGHLNKPVVALAIHPTGDELLTGGSDGRVLRWRKADPPPPAGTGWRVAKLPPPLPVLTEFYQDLRGSRAPVSPLAVFGTKPELAARPDDRGMHVRVDANPEQTDRIGLDLPARVFGDFEITAAYEILRADRPKDGHGVGVCLVAELDAPAGEMLELTRVARPHEGDVYGCFHKTVEAGKDKYHYQWYPSRSRAGHLRMTRKGGELTFSARDGGAGTFKVLQRAKCGTEDVRQVQFAAYMGFAQNSVDVALKDLRIGPPGSGPVAAMDPAELAAERTAEPTVAPTRGRFHLILAGLLTLLLLLVAVFAFVFAGRRKQYVRPERIAADPAEESPRAIVFACPGCGKKLRTQATAAGKSVRCPGCGGQAVVPGGEGE